MVGLELKSKTKTRQRINRAHTKTNKETDTKRFRMQRTPELSTHFELNLEVRVHHELNGAIAISSGVHVLSLHVVVAPLVLAHRDHRHHLVRLLRVALLGLPVPKLDHGDVRELKSNSMGKKRAGSGAEREQADSRNRACARRPTDQPVSTFHCS